jgi:hypothetical protein
MKINKSDKFPSLEIIVELEDEKINPLNHFVYLHNIESELDDEFLDDFKYKVEKIDYADNIGKSFILLDFDKSKK